MKRNTFAKTLIKSMEVKKVSLADGLKRGSEKDFLLTISIFADS